MSCYSCKNFSEFKTPREFDGYAVHGMCYKKNKLYAAYPPQAYPVYVPGGSCKDYKRDLSRPKEQPPAEGQIRMEV